MSAIGHAIEACFSNQWKKVGNPLPAVRILLRPCDALEVDTPAPAAVQPDAVAEVATETPASAAEQPAAPA
eukprot:1803378-Pleurochrysis_carterae.AAC.1